MMDWYLPGTKAGGPVRSVFSLVTLLKNDFDFYIVTTNLDLGINKPYSEIVPNTLILKEGVYYYYFDKAQLNSNSMQAVLSKINPGLIYINSFWSFNFSISLVYLKNKGLLTAPLLLAPRGMLGKGALGLKSFKKQLFLFFSKNLGWYKNVIFQATQSQEESDIRAKYKFSKILVAPNINAASAVQNISIKEKNTIKLFFLSRISPVKNLHFALEVLKLIPEKYTVSYDIFGNLESTEYWQVCEQIIATLPENVSVVYKKELQFNEVQDTICHYHFLFLPTLNENFGHSIVESLLCGCPAIISDQTPWTDLEINNAGFAIDLNAKQKFVSAIVSSAEMEQEDFLRSSRAAAKYIQKKIDLKQLHNQYKKLFNDIIKN